MWSFLRARFNSPADSRLREEAALGCLPDLYRIAYFLSGSRLAAEELVQSACVNTWRKHSRGGRIGELRLSLLRALLNVAQDSPFCRGEAARDESPPRLWEALSKLAFDARTLILLNTLDLPLPQIAWVVKVPVTLAAERLQAARNDFDNYCRDE
jgi:DNA-directed RNA polymerase specialized sigma24 family protein